MSETDRHPTEPRARERTAPARFRTIELFPSYRRSLVLLALCTALAVGSAWTAYAPAKAGEPFAETSFYRGLGVCLAAWFCALALVHVRRLVRRDPTLVLSRDGLSVRTAFGGRRFVPWGAVVDVAVKNAYGKALAVRATDAYRTDRIGGEEAVRARPERRDAPDRETTLRIAAYPLAIDHAALERLLRESVRQHRAHGVDGWDRWRADAAAFELAPRAGPGRLAGLTAHGKGLSIGGAVTAAAFAFVGLGLMSSELLRRWRGGSDCPSSGEPCERLGTIDALGWLLGGALLGGPALLLLLGKLLSIGKGVSDGTPAASRRPSDAPLYTIGGLVAFFNLLPWLLLCVAGAALLLASISSFLD